MDNFTREYRLQQWALMVQDQRQSGFTVKEWCNRNHITKDAFYYRLKRVRTAMAGQLLPASEADASPVFAEWKQPVYKEDAFPAEACIHTAGADIYLGGNASSSLIANILRAVQPC